MASKQILSLVDAGDELAIADAIDAAVCTVGAWQFDPALGTLSNGAEVRRLEHRAAAVLAILARRRGEVVSRQELLDEVWHGRTVSPNSVAIVVGDLRRALDDDPKAPALLVTVAKRGYRLAPAPYAEATPRPARPAVSRRRTSIVAIAGTVCLLAFAGAVWRWHGPAPRDAVRLVAGPVSNQTGLAQDAPLASALDGLLVNRLTRIPGLAVERQDASQGMAPRSGTLLFGSKLVLWNGLPTLEMSLVDQTSHRVVWSGMAVGDADHIADETIARLAELRQRLAAPPGPQQDRRSIS